MKSLNKSNITINTSNADGRDSFSLEATFDNEKQDAPGKFGNLNDTMSTIRTSGISNETSRTNSINWQIDSRATSMISGLALTDTNQYDMERTSSMISVMTDENSENRVILVNKIN